MTFLIFIARIFASILLLTFLFAGILKANPKTHKQGPAAEYTAGFLICMVSVIGLYYLWFK